jgi:D-amino-acid dehydrogenase
LKSVLIVGGGVIGLTSAYFLSEAGYQVTVIDSHDFLTNCSPGNAGLIVPSHFIPLAAPGVINKALRWAFNSKGPFSVHLSPNADLLKWGYRFWRASTPERVKKAVPVLFQLNTLSKKLYKEITHASIETEYRETGLLMLYRTKETAHEEEESVEIANKLGIDAQMLTASEIQNKFSGTSLDVIGGVYYPCDASINPGLYVNSLITLLQKRNVRLLENHELTDFVIKNSRIEKAVTNKGTLEFDEVVIAAGALSQNIFNKLGLKIFVQAGKGYSFIKKTKPEIKIPMILLEARVAVTPYETFTRFAGIMEIAGKAGVINNKRVAGMVESIHKFMPDITLDKPEPSAVWSGLRPCSIDGLPYIGRVEKYSNLIVATGHSMMGISLAPITGKLVEELLSGKKTSKDLASLAPER